jgi:hypothetical protein
LRRFGPEEGAHERFSMKKIPDLFDVLEKSSVNRWARLTGFVKRTGILKPYEFLVLLVVGQMGMKHPSLAGMVAAIRARITKEALHQRFNKAASAFLSRCLRFVLRQKLLPVAIRTDLLRPFRRVLLVDSSSWDVDEELRGVLPGSGGGASSASCKIQAAYEYKGVYRLWGLLPQKDKQEFEAIFSHMAKRLVKELAKAGPGQ